MTLTGWQNGLASYKCWKVFKQLFVLRKSSKPGRVKDFEKEIWNILSSAPTPTIKLITTSYLTNPKYLLSKQLLYYVSCVSYQGSPEEPATGDFLRVLKHITPATNFGSILFLVQHFKCIFYRNKEAKQLVYFVRQTNILLTSISVL